MKDGSTIAISEVPDLPPEGEPVHPAYKIFNHIALKVDTIEDLQAYRGRLIEHGIEVQGPVDHMGESLSIYFRDPSDMRMELAVNTDPSWNKKHQEGIGVAKRFEEARRLAHEIGDTDGKMLREHIVKEVARRSRH